MASADLLTSGAPAWRNGRAGPAAIEANAGVQEGIARCRSILQSRSPLSAAAVVDASEALLDAAGDRNTGLRAVDRAAVVSRLRQLVCDEKTPDGVAVRAFRLVLRATGRKRHQKGDD